MSPRAASSTSTKPAPWVGHRQFVVVVDGPLAGRWYFADGPSSWAELVLAAERMADHRAARDPVLDYVVDTRDRNLVDHPHEPAVGRPLHYAPHQRAERNNNP